MKSKKNLYTTIQVKKEVNQHIKTFCKRYGVSAAKITELMWANYISSSLHIKEIISVSEPAHSLLISSSMSGSLLYTN